MKNTLFVFAAILAMVPLYAQEEAELNRLLAQGRREDALRLMQEWERKKPTDPQMFIAWANYYFQKDAEAGMAPMDRPNPNGPSMTMTKPGEPATVVGFIWERTFYVRDNVIQAVDYLTRALEHHPRRLDILFGRVYLWQEIGDYRAMADAYMEALRTAHRYRFDLLWGPQGVVPGGDVKKFFFDSSMDYYNIWLQTINPIGMVVLQEAAELQTQLIPENPYGWNLLAAAYMRRERYSEAASILETALQKFPDDNIVRNNYAFTLWQMGELENAKEQYILLLGKRGIDQELLRENIQTLEELIRQRDAP